jgi:hypothetical protein
MNPGKIFLDHKLPNNKQLKKNAREQRWLDNKRKKKIKVDTESISEKVGFEMKHRYKCNIRKQINFP